MLNWLKNLVDVDRETENVVRAVDTAMGDLPSTLRFMSHYASWNGYFGSGVAALAAKIGRNRTLFVDPEERVAVLSDRSVLVASYFFDAARDEFDDRNTSHRDTHRCLAQALLSGLCSKLASTDSSWTAARINALLVEPGWLAELGSVVATGYGARSDDTLAATFEAIGYHLGSELFADREFTQIDARLRELDSSLVDYLMAYRARIDGVEHSAYHWLRIHSGHGGAAEAEHFALATQGVSRAIRYARGLPESEIKEAISTGYRRFASDHKQFFRHVLSA